MSLLVLGDSNVERSWLNVRNNRDLLRGAVFVPVKRYDQIVTGFSSMMSSVSSYLFMILIHVRVRNEVDTFPFEVTYFFKVLMCNLVFLRWPLSWCLSLPIVWLMASVKSALAKGLLSRRFCQSLLDQAESLLFVKLILQLDVSSPLPTLEIIPIGTQDFDLSYLEFCNR